MPRKPRTPGAPLSNPRHERYAIARARGATIEAASEIAGLAPGRGNGPDNPAQRPIAAYDVRDRIRELVASGMKEHELTIEVPINAYLRQIAKGEDEAAIVRAADGLVRVLDRGSGGREGTGADQLAKLIRAAGDQEMEISLERLVVSLPGEKSDKR